MPPIVSPTRFPSLERLEQAIKKIVVFVLRLLFRSFPPKNISLEHVQAVLVVRQHDQLGDMLCAVPLLRALRTRFPDAHITLIANPVNYDIMRHHPYVNEVLNYDKQLFFRKPGRLFEFYRAMRKHRYDLAVVPVTVSISLTSNVLALLSRASLRVGAERLAEKDNPASFLFHVTSKLDWSEDPHRHQTQRNLDIVRPLGISTNELHHLIGITDDERADASRFLASFKAGRSTLIGFHPGAGKIGNRWPAEHFATIANMLYERFSVGVVITSGPMDDEPVHTMLRHIHPSYLIVRRKPIREVAAIISHLSLFITNDTGIMHVAAGVGTPTLSLFGPTDPKQWAPLGEKNRYIQSDDGDIHSITVDEAFNAASEMIKISPSSPFNKGG